MDPSRRSFLKTTAGLSTAAFLPDVFAAHPGGSDELRVGVIGCGGRGTGAAANCLDADPSVRIVALGDLFKDKLDSSRAHLAKRGERAQVPPERCFTGFDAYQQVLAAGVDAVILAAPPAFRPAHLRAAVEAGKHVFCEKPVATCPTGVRSIIESSEIAKTKGLTIVAGTQRRHQEHYVEAMKRIQDGAIGDLLSAEVYWLQGGLWHVDRKPEYSDAEWQIRNWLYFTWLAGDTIVEQHVHQIDVAAWAFRANPVKVIAVGGRSWRTDPVFGNVYDHFTTELEYPGGARVTSWSRQADGTVGRVSEHLVGTKGTADLSHGAARITGPQAWTYKSKEPPDPYRQEHVDLVRSIRGTGAPINEGRQVAESTLAAIMGRMAAYTGQEVTWDFATTSKLDLVPKNLAFGPLPVAEVAVPGKTKLA
jgi:predicted dehydrogenase